MEHLYNKNFDNENRNRRYAKRFKYLLYSRSDEINITNINIMKLYSTRSCLEFSHKIPSKFQFISS